MQRMAGELFWQNNKKFYEMINANTPREVFERMLNQDINVFVFDPRALMDFLTMADWPIDYIKDNLDRLLSRQDGRQMAMYPIIKYAMRVKRYDVIMLLAYHPNLNVRAEFMKNITSEYRNYIEAFYPNGITNYFVNKDSNGVVEIMDERDVSQIACNLFDCNFKEDIFQEIKEFIFNNYSLNHLAQYIDRNIEHPHENDLFHYRETLLKDINRYFETSVNYKYELIENYDEFITSPMKKDYLEIYNEVFKKTLKDYVFAPVITDAMLCDMRDTFLSVVSKYYKNSQSKQLVFKGMGTTTFAIGIDDYVLKLSTDKHLASFTTPDNFLVVKDYEYYEHRDFFGFLKETVEVQPNLTKPYKVEEDKDGGLEKMYREQLAKEGYELLEEFIKCGNVNCFFLDDYHDANCENKEELPAWFKEKPLVLIDRDLVIPIDKKEEYENSHGLILK